VRNTRATDLGLVGASDSPNCRSESGLTSFRQLANLDSYMLTVKIHHAKTHLSRLIEKACDAKRSSSLAATSLSFAFSPCLRNGAAQAWQHEGKLKVGPEFFEPSRRGARSLGVILRLLLDTHALLWWLAVISAPATRPQFIRLVPNCFRQCCFGMGDCHEIPHRQAPASRRPRFRFDASFFRNPLISPDTSDMPPAPDCSPARIRIPFDRNAYRSIPAENLPSSATTLSLTLQTSAASGLILMRPLAAVSTLLNSARMTLDPFLSLNRNTAAFPRAPRQC